MNRLIVYSCRVLRPIIPIWVGLVALFLLSPGGNIQAEGSREFTANGGNRALLAYRNDSPTAQGSLLLRTYVKVYANVGETINVGSSANGLGSRADAYDRFRDFCMYFVFTMRT